MTSMLLISQQLVSLNESLRQTQPLIARLAKLTFQPGSEALDETQGSVRLELAQDIQDSLKQSDEALESLRADIEELNAESGISKRKGSEKEQERERLSVDFAKLDEEAKHARASFRQAQLSAKRASEAAKTQERELVFQSTVSAPSDSGEHTAPRGHKRGRTQQLSKDEVLANASSDVTSALRRTHELLATEVGRSRFAQETFDESTEALKDLGEKYNDLDSILSNSRGLLSTLIRSQKSDTWYLETAFYILLTTLVWLVFRRILYGPFFKLPTFLWRIVSLITNWTILKPLYYFLLLIGVIRTEPVPLPSRAETSASRPPLIIKPSASDFPSNIPQVIMEQIRRDGTPAGAGGAGAKVGKDALAGQESEKIAQLAEQSREPVRRGDGTILQERGDIPKNPKKKVFEPEPEAEARKDEL